MTSPASAIYPDHEDLSTESQYNSIIQEAQIVFGKKTRDYGTAWRILRVPTLTDQIMIKAQRIRSIQEKGEQKVEDSIRDEFIGIVNYCIIALIQMNAIESDAPLEVGDKVLGWYDDEVEQIKELLFAKNHDYNEAWREMRVSSMTDIILMKLLRIKQIENNDGQTEISEGIAAGYQDIVNYSVFCLILLDENDK